MAGPRTEWIIPFKSTSIGNNIDFTRCHFVSDMTQQHHQHYPPVDIVTPTPLSLDSHTQRTAPSISSSSRSPAPVRRLVKSPAQQQSARPKAVRIEHARHHGRLNHLIFRELLDHQWFSWIKPKLTRRHLRPVIRCAIAVSSLDARQKLIVGLGRMGYTTDPCQRACSWTSRLQVEASVPRLIAVFLLVVAFILPPYQPVLQVFESYLNMFFFAALGWAWVRVVAVRADAGGPRHLHSLNRSHIDRPCKDL